MSQHELMMGSAQNSVGVPDDPTCNNCGSRMQAGDDPNQVCFHCPKCGATSVGCSDSLEQVETVTEAELEG